MSEENGNGKPTYRRKPARAKTVTFDVETADGVAVVTAKNLTISQFRGLSDAISGELPDGGDPTGKKYQDERVLKLELTVERFENVEGDDGADVAAFLRLAGNEDLAWLTYEAYFERLFGRHSKSRDVAPGPGDEPRVMEANAGGEAVA